MPLDALVDVSVDDRLTDHRIQQLLILPLERAKFLEIIVLVVLDIDRLLTQEEVNDVVGLKFLLKHTHCLEYADQCLFCFHSLMVRFTVIAVVTVILLVSLSEVVEEKLPSAYRALCIGLHLFEKEGAHDPLVIRLILTMEELRHLVDVCIAVVSDAESLSAVPPRSTGLLVVALQALRDVVMDHEADVRLVDPHPESYRRHDDIDALVEERILRLIPHLALDPGVVGECLDVVGPEHLGEVLHLLAAHAVDDPALVVVLLDEADDIRLHLAVLPSDLVVEIGPIEGAAEDPRVPHLERLQDILLHHRRRGRRESDDGTSLDLIDDLPDAAVLRPEVMTPLADTVRLVHGVEGYRYRLEELHILLLRQTLRSDEEHLSRSARQVGTHLLQLRLGERGVHHMSHGRVCSAASDRIHLILHQSDEWRDDDRGALADQGGQLVAEGLASAGRHKHEGVMTGQDARYDLGLLTLEGVEAKEVLEGLV